MIKYKFLRIDQITSYYKDEVSLSSAKKRIASNQYKSTVPFIIEEDNGKYFLVRGFKYYDALYTLRDRQPIACMVSTHTSANYVDRLLNILKRNFDNRSESWKLRWFFIHKLTHHCKLDMQTIANYLNKDVSEIKKYEIDADVPDYFKQKAIETNTSGLVNEICLLPSIPPNQKEQYYHLAVTGRFSYFQLYLTLSSYNMGYYAMYAHPFALFRVVF